MLRSAKPLQSHVVVDFDAKENRFALSVPLSCLGCWAIYQFSVARVGRRLPAGSLGGRLQQHQLTVPPTSYHAEIVASRS